MSETPQLDLQLSDAPALGAGQEQLIIKDASIDQTAFWQAEPLELPVQNPPLSSMVEVQIASPKSSSNSVTVVLGTILLLGVVWFGWRFFAFNETPDQAIAGLLGDPSELPEEPTKPMTPRKTTSVSESVKAATGITPHPELTSPAPYLNLVNGLSGKPRKRVGIVRSEENEAALETFSGPDYYPKYKLVSDLVAEGQQGSESLLREAMKTGQLWMRMNAAIGLADLGYLVTKEEIAQALGDSHSELRQRFFKRFEAPGRCTPGCFMVVRGAMPYLDAPGRLAAMKVIALESSEFSGGFLVAGIFDTDEQVKQFATKTLLRQPVSEMLWWKTFEIIFGKLSSSYSLKVEHSATETVGAKTDLVASTALKNGAVASAKKRSIDVVGSSNGLEAEQNKDVLSTMAALFGGAVVGLLALVTIILLLGVASYARLFSIAGEPWWASFVPFYNIYVMTKIARVSPLVFVATLVPVVTIFASAYLLFHFAKAYKEEDSYCVMFTVFNPIMAPILAFSSTTSHLDTARAEAIARPSVSAAMNHIPIGARAASKVSA